MYSNAPLISDAEAMAKTIRGADSDERLKLQAHFGRLLQEIERAGIELPSRLRNLHEQLLEEAIEARFDNLPI